MYTLESLQSKSNEELNDIAAIDVMGWNCNIVNRVVQIWSDVLGKQIKLTSDWNPTNDMNDAMELLNKFMDWQISINHGLNDWACTISNGYVRGSKHINVESESLPKSITIAAILANQERK